MIKILIVDDKTENIYLLQAMLDTNGFKTISAKNGAEALGLLRTVIPDLIISDILMPVMDGFTLCRECKKDETLKNIPFFFYTATYTDSKDEEYALSLGADRFILKPQEPDDFVKMINDFLNEVKKKTLRPKEIIQQAETIVLKEYNEVLIRKIEDKMLQTEKSEKELKKYAEELEKEILERKKNEGELYRSEERFRTLYNDAVVGLYRTNKDGEILLANKTLIKMLGFKSLEELKARNLNESGYGTLYQRQNFIDQIEKEGKILNIEATWISRDGKEIYVRESAKMICDSERKVIYYDGTVENITEQKKATNALNKIQHLFETMTLVSPVGIFRTTPEGNTTYVNPKWTELSGLSSEEALGKGWLNAVHPEDREKISMHWVNDIQSKNESQAEYRFLKPDGSVIWVIGRAVPEMIDNTVAGYIGTITDITYRKSVEEALIESEAKYRQLVTHSPDGIFVIDFNGKFLSVNQAIWKHLMYTEKELLNINMQDIIVEKYLAVHKQRLASILNGESTNTYAEYEIIKKDGNPALVEVLSVPYYKGKEIIGFQGIARDITARKLAEEAIRTSETLFRALFENAGEGILYISSEAQITRLNESFARMHGFTIEEMGKFNLQDLDVDDLSRVFPERIKQMKNGENLFFEVKHFHKDGHIIEIEVSAFMIDLKGEDYVVAFHRDITERKRAEAELIKAKDKAEESDRLKTAFLHNISHEIRTPMNSIVGFSELIVDPDITPEIRNEFIQTIVQSSNQLLSIITQIVSMATIEAGQEKLYEKEISLNSIFKIVFDQYHSEAVRKNISLKYNTALPENEDKLKTDETKLIQIISNLLGNALKFSKKGSIDVGYVVKDKYLEFYFKDTGIGIPKDLQEKIFERFRQVETSLSREYEGSGLGLSISKGYVELLGGKIWVTSSLGEGSTFYFTIPFNKASQSKIPKGGVANKFELKKSITILIAEDENNNLKLLEHYLSNANIVLMYAANGSEAVEICKKNRQISLVLMDLKMPIMDGFEAAKIIKELRPDLPIVAQTAYARDVDKTKAIDCGCSDFISKPYKKEELLALIRDYTVLD